MSQAFAKRPTSSLATAFGESEIIEPAKAKPIDISRKSLRRESEFYVSPHLGSREVTDFGGSLFTEKRLAAHYGIIGTPAIQFFPRQADGLAARQPREREVARMEALPAQDGFLPMFQQVVG